ncbi:MAG: HAD-IA family hydrolase [Bacteroidota bacterium]
MNIKALFIGSIGVVTETSDYQRRAYNQAMKENGLSWNWDKDTYKELLKSNGGKLRLEVLSSATGQPLEQSKIDKIHARKTEIAGELVRKDQLKPRTGLIELIKSAKADGAIVAWVTSTYEANTNALIEASNGELTADHFDHIFHRTDINNSKPAPDAYQNALRHFNLEASECVAIEDSLTSLLAAKAADVFTVATLGDFHDEQVENIADLVLDHLGVTSWAELKKEAQASRQMAYAA